MSGYGQAAGAGLGAAGAVTSGIGSSVETLGALFGNTGKMTFPWKWPELGRSVMGSLKTAEANKRASDISLGDFLTEWRNALPQFKVWGQEAINAINPFYSGEVATDNARLRAAALAAKTNPLWGQRAMRSVNEGMVGVPGGGTNSWRDREVLRAMIPYQLQANVEDVAQERADANYERQMQLALGNERSNILANQARQGLVPDEVRQKYYTDYLNNLAALENLFNAGTYSKYKPSTTEIIGGGLKEQGGYLMQAGAAASGGGGGGGSSQPNPTTGQNRFQIPQPAPVQPWTPYGYGVTGSGPIGGYSGWGGSGITYSSVPAGTPYGYGVTGEGPLGITGVTDGGFGSAGWGGW